MTWLEIALIGAVLVGATAGTVLVVRNPVFWSGLTVAMIKAALPIITKRMKPEEEAQWRKSTRLPDGEDAFNRKRRGAPPKG